MLDYLPQQLVVSIFLNLPIETLIRCTSVCKSWHSLITSSTFISTHDHHQKPHILLHHTFIKPNNSWIERFSLNSDSNSLDEIRPLEFPFKNPTDKYFSRITKIPTSRRFCEIIASCRGLFCLTDDNVGYQSSVIIWNPMIQKSLTIYCPLFVNKIINRLVGFGFDSRTNDFKVIILNYYDKCKFSPNVDVYSHINSSWRQNISAIAPPHLYTDPAWQAFMNGSVHWIVKKTESKNQYFIMFFDIINEVFGEMMLPSMDYCRDTTRIDVIRESLSVYELHDGFSGYYINGGCSIWIMKEYGVAESWIKHLVVKFDGVFPKILGSRTNGDLLLGINSELVSCNLETQKIKKHGIRGFFHASSYCGTFTGSLIMIKPSNGASWERMEDRASTRPKMSKRLRK